MTTNFNTAEMAYTLPELIEYYEICNKAENKSLKTISWYSANLKTFHNYLKNRHLSQSLENISIKILREYVIYLSHQI
jgi:site-specific recombinase XerD